MTITIVEDKKTIHPATTAASDGHTVAYPSVGPHAIEISTVLVNQATLSPKQSTGLTL